MDNNEETNNKTIKYQIIMKQKEMKMVAYVAPDVSIYEIHPEGALCTSGVEGVTVRDLEYDEDELGC